MPRATTATADETTADLPRLERASRTHALRFAREMFVRGERVDMQTLASALGVGRSTLYRWVGDRERLIGDVLAELSQDIWEQVARDATGTGLDRALDRVRRFMEVTGAFDPLRRFAQREPEPALRILMSEDGVVAAAIRAGIVQALAEDAPHLTAAPSEIIDMIVQFGTALEWAPIVIGEPPAIERATHLTRTLLETSARADRHA